MANSFSGLVTIDGEVNVISDKVCTVMVHNKPKYKEPPLHFRLKIFNGRVETAKNYFKKGKQIFVIGTIHIDDYDFQREGVEQLEVLMDNFDFVDNKSVKTVSDEDEGEIGF